jgi:replication factor C subunit 3/5
LVRSQIAKILTDIASKENLSVSSALALSIAEESGRNLRRAILMLEAAKVKFPALGSIGGTSAAAASSSSGPPPVNASMLKADWEQFIDGMGKSICEEQSPQRLLRIRNNLYELLTNAIPPDVIMRQLTIVLLKRADDTLKHEIAHYAAFYDHRMHQGSKAIFHLEAFVAKFMALYKRWVVESFA